MISRIAIAAIAVSVAAQAAWAANPAASSPKLPACVDMTDAKTSLIRGGGHWTVLTRGQYHFISGVYAAAPSTPVGLPPGDSAVLAQEKGDKDGVVIFMKGGKGCFPMPAPEVLIRMMDQIVTGKLDDDGEEM